MTSKKSTIKLTLKKVGILFSILMAVYVFSKSGVESGETVLSRFLPYSILHESNFDLDEFYGHLREAYPWLIYKGESGEEIPYYLIKVKGRYLSTDGPGPAIVALPFFYIPVIIFNLPPESQGAIFLTKLIANFLIAFSAIFIYLSVRCLSGEKKAWLITFIYALCSNMWSVTSQQLCQPTGSAFFLALSIYFLVKGSKNPKFIPYAGFSMASAVLMRPTNAVTMIIVSIYILHRHRHKFWQYVLWAAPVTLFILGYNHYYHGSMFSFSQIIYNPMGAIYKSGSPEMWSTPLWAGVLGILVSPSRGLLIYSPVFIFSFMGAILAWTNNKRVIFKYFSVAIIPLIIIHAKWFDWWGGWTFGSRVLNECIPFLSLLILPAIDFLKNKRMVILIFILTILVSFSIQMMGAFLYDNEWNKNPNVDQNPSRLWSWRDGQLVHYFHRLSSKED